MNNKRPKYGGRKAGTPNKITGDVRRAMAEFLQDNWGEVQRCFDELTDPKDKLVLLLKFAEFVVPKMRAVDNTHLIEQRIDSLTENQVNELIDVILEQNNDDE